MGDRYQLKHREFVTSLTYTTLAGYAGELVLLPPTDNALGLDLNPGNERLFPWLSTQAGAWEKYRFNRVKFYLYPKQPTTAQGWVCMCFDYDYNDPIPRTKGHILTNKTVCDGSVWMEHTLALDTGMLNEGMPWRYVAVNASTEPRTSYAGFLTIALDGLTPSTNYGFDLWCEYDITLNIPCPPDEDVANFKQLQPLTRTQAVDSLGRYVFRPGLDSFGVLGPLVAAYLSPAPRNSTNVEYSNVLDISTWTAGSRLGLQLQTDTAPDTTGGATIGFDTFDSSKRYVGEVLLPSTPSFSPFDRLSSSSFSRAYGAPGKPFESYLGAERSAFSSAVRYIAPFIRSAANNFAVFASGVDAVGMRAMWDRL
jgi:hypothetical protein